MGGPPSAASGIGWLMASAAAQRVTTFALNALLIAHVDADVLGFAAADMELLTHTLVFVARESARLTAARFKVAGKRPADRGASADDRNDSGATSSDDRELVQVAWLPVLFGTVLCSIALVASMHMGGSSEEASARSLFVAAAWTELLAEPALVFMQAYTMLPERASVEMFAAVMRAVVTFVCVAWLGLHRIGFALGYTASAAVTVAMATMLVLSRIGVSLVRLLPSLRRPWLGLSRATWSRLCAFTCVCTLKHGLTEGDRLLMTMLASRADRGVYAVATNYGSILARIVFQPMEESLRVTVSAAHTHTHTGFADAVAAFQLRGIVVMLIGALASVFGHAFAPLVVRVLLGTSWLGTALPSALSVYALYLAFMAANGVTEAFATASADTTRVMWSSVHMAVAFGMYAAMVWMLVPRHGIVGLIIGNIANMCIRIASSVWYMHQQSVKVGVGIGWRRVLPSLSILAALAVTKIALTFVAPACDVVIHDTTLPLLSVLHHPACVTSVGVGTLGLGGVMALVATTYGRALLATRRADSAERVKAV